MNVSLYEISADFLKALDGLEVNEETGEITNFDAVEALNAQFEDKAESVACYIKNLTAFVADLKTEEDALAARRQERVCRTVQVSDTGIVPGSGVGNARMALDEEHLGIPVIAVGVPTVVEAATLCLDLLDQAGQEGFDPALFRQEGAEWFVTPRNVDSEVETLSRVLGLGISTALHVDFSVEDVEKWIS